MIKQYKELTEEVSELEKKLDSASKDSVQRKLEINQKLSELEELRKTVDGLPPELIKIARNNAANKEAATSKNKEKRSVILFGN